MKRAYILIVIISLISLSALISKVSADPSSTIFTNFHYLTTRDWKLKEIEVGGYSYIDSVTTNLKFSFNPNGTCIVNNNASQPVPWQFQNPDQKVLLMNPGSGQHVLNLQYIGEDYFIYDVNYNVEGITYNYIFRFAAIEP